MASNYTEQYNLCQWEATDQVLRTDFNEDNAKLEAALNALQDGKAEKDLCYLIGDTLSETNRKLNDLISRVEALEAKV